MLFWNWTCPLKTFKTDFIYVHVPACLCMPCPLKQAREQGEGAGSSGVIVTGEELNMGARN